MNNLPKSSESDQTLPLHLSIRGVGVIPAKKNSFYPGVEGRVLIDKGVKQRMERLRRAIEYLLFSGIQTSGNGMSMEASHPVLIALLTQSPPFDDNWMQVELGEARGELCVPGDEGVTITIERIG